MEKETEKKTVPFGDHKRYHTLYSYNMQIFGGRVYKACLDVGCSCPNRDGTAGHGGCIFCDSGSRYFAGTGTVTEQLQAERERIHKKRPEAKLIAYFQAGTNTYGVLTQLKHQWREALTFPNVVGISIATRADCLGEPVLEALEELHRQTHLTVELGLQTIHDETAMRIGRGHGFDEFLRGYGRLQQRGIRTCVHLIDGLPGEDSAMMVETARQLGMLRPGGVKLHLLHVNRGTPLEALWQRGAYVPLTREEDVAIIAEQLRYFPPETVMERLTGDGDKRVLLAPLWSRDKIAVLGAVDQYLAEKQYLQGDRFGIEK